MGISSKGKGKAASHGTSSKPRAVASRPPRDGDAESTSKTKSVKPLVWMNFSDPLEQSKDKENKTTVKKTAMLNRSRQTWARSGRKKVIASQPQQVADEVIPTYPDTPQIASLVDGANTDPFDTLPMKADRHSHELVRFYLNGGSATPIAVETRVGVKKFRMKYLAPLLLDSPLSYSTLMAWMDKVTHLPSDVKPHSYFEDHLGVALSGAKTALLHLENYKEMRALAISIGLLLTVAQAMGDTRAMYAHLYGLAALLSRHWDMYEDDLYFKACVTGWALYKDAFENNDSYFCLPEFMRPSFLLADQARRPDDHRGSGFAHLVRRGLISPPLAKSTYYVLYQSVLLEQVRHNKLSALETTELIRFMWFNGWSLYNLRKNCTTIFENCCRFTILMYHWIDLSLAHCTMAYRMGIFIYEQLSVIDVDALLLICPDALLWMALVSGPHTKGTTRVWFKRLLAAARIVLSLQTFYAAVHDHAIKFLWVSTMNPSGLDLWVESANLQVPKMRPYQKRSTDFESDLRNIHHDAAMIGLTPNRTDFASALNLLGSTPLEKELND